MLKLNLVFAILCGVFIPSFAFGMNVLKQVQIKDESKIDLIFDGRIDPHRIVTEYFNDIVQLSIHDVSIYPAKITLLKGKLVSKLFAYQYSPHLVRCRFSVIGKAEDFKNHVEVLSRDGRVSVNFGTKGGPVEEKSDEKLDEKEIINKVLNTGPEKGQDVQKSLENSNDKSETSHLATGKPLPAFGPVLLKLAFVIALLLLSLMFLKKLKTLGSQRKSGMLTAIKRFAKGSLKQSENLIEIVSIHHLDPKKSIAVARVAGRLMVLGISSDSINLITQISETSPDLESFEELLGNETGKPIAKADPQSQSTTLGARSRIRNRLEGLKQL